MPHDVNSWRRGGWDWASHSAVWARLLRCRRSSAHRNPNRTVVLPSHLTWCTPALPLLHYHFMNPLLLPFGRPHTWLAALIHQEVVTWMNLFAFCSLTQRIWPEWETPNSSPTTTTGPLLIWHPIIIAAQVVIELLLAGGGATQTTQRWRSSQEKHL